MKCQKRVYDVAHGAGIMLFARSLEQVLVICDKKGAWRFPWSKLQPGELFVETASRALLTQTRIERAAFSLVDCPIPIISSGGLANSSGKNPVPSKLRFLFPAILRSAELVKLEAVLGSTSDVAWLSRHEARVATKNPKRIAALELGHAIAKAIPEDLIATSEEIVFESVAVRGVSL